MNRSAPARLSTLLICLLPLLAQAKGTPDEIAGLGKDMTPMGAIKAGNADGSIPAWTGKLFGLPKGVAWKGPGHHYPDLYAHEKPLYTITAANQAKYAERLTPGQKAMLKRYPDTFRLPVYPSHRDARFPQIYYDRVKYNAEHAELDNGDDGIVGYTGALAFPFPKSGAEVVWNTRTNEPTHILEGTHDDIAVFSNGSTSVRRNYMFAENVYANPDTAVGVEYPALGNFQGYVYNEFSLPTRDKGTITTVFEPMDYNKFAREAWRYLPGSRRVRRAPTVGYDTPDGPGGLVTIDEVRGFNGAMDRFAWTSLGRKEVYIPYNNYKFDDPSVDTKDLLTRFHANPDYMRYELHRVWVVEAKLRPGKRHIYGRRLIYIDEDTGLAVITENFDGRGELWKVVLINSFYEYGSRYIVRRAQVYHDLRAGAYVAMRVVNTGKPFTYNVAPARGPEYFSPANVRKLGKR